MSFFKKKKDPDPIPMPVRPVKGNTIDNPTPVKLGPGPEILVVFIDPAPVPQTEPEKKAPVGKRNPMEARLFIDRTILAIVNGHPSEEYLLGQLYTAMRYLLGDHLTNREILINLFAVIQKQSERLEMGLH